ncbi:MAG: hypothetical protein Q4F18_03145 [Clostridia bacterium]|nr:hypothetical protein [Clostridia bacterium]
MKRLLGMMLLPAARMPGAAPAERSKKVLSPDSTGPLNLARE